MKPRKKIPQDFKGSQELNLAPSCYFCLLPLNCCLLCKKDLLLITPVIIKTILLLFASPSSGANPPWGITSQDLQLSHQKNVCKGKIFHCWSSVTSTAHLPAHIGHTLAQPGIAPLGKLQKNFYFLSVWGLLGPALARVISCLCWDISRNSPAAAPSRTGGQH